MERGSSWWLACGCHGSEAYAANGELAFLFTHTCPECAVHRIRARTQAEGLDTRQLHFPLMEWETGKAPKAS